MKHEYMIREDYVRTWTVRDALRELIANAIDAEVEQGAAARVYQDGSDLVISNQGTRLDVEALYLGGSNRAGSTRAIGQYGEGMKLALLVLTRNNFTVKIENDTEVWTPSLEPDKNGIRAFAINTRAKKVPSGKVVVTIENVSDELFLEATQMFLRLCPAQDVIPTSEGEIILDSDRTGFLFVRGVFITKLTNAMAGYNVKDLEVSRDRRSFEQHQLTPKIQTMWGEASSRKDAARAVFDGFLNGAGDLQSARGWANDQLTENMIDVFRARYGDQALPVTSTGEGAELEHLGARGVVVPITLAEVLRRKLPTPQAFKTEQSRKVLQRFSFEELEPAERALLNRVFHDLGRIGCDIEKRTTVVQFGSPTIEGLHQDRDILLARHCLKTYGKAAGVLLHEAAHDKGADASKAHVDKIHEYMEALLTLLAK